ncbi:hypothetical protein AB0940_29000 [Streptomyces sp. NPDC006656]|uniref:hypothetical protein n=1 Tax=Streptomyces sp. NPDC006656 TaxID=3156899 RepID=UPI0034520423
MADEQAVSEHEKPALYHWKGPDVVALAVVRNLSAAFDNESPATPASTKNM